MNKKAYSSPMTILVKVKTESLLSNASQMNPELDQLNITPSNEEQEGAFPSRRYNVWDD